MNSESAQSSNKRLFDNDDLSQPEKQFKQENRIILKDNNYLQVIKFYLAPIGFFHQCSLFI